MNLCCTHHSNTADISRGKLLPRSRFRVARGLSRSSFRSPEASGEVVLRVARGLWRPAFMSPEASGDSFESRERLWRHKCRSPEASGSYTILLYKSLSLLSNDTSREASGDLNDDRQSLSRLSNDVAGGLSRLSNDFARGLWRSK